jgi:hypothetical protein
LTPWRTLLAAALDQFPAHVTAATLEAERRNPSADLLAAWMEDRLRIPVRQTTSSGPGITAVRMTTAAGDIAITRPDGLLASYAVPGQPNRLVALKRRTTADLIAEELRRMDHDVVYEATLKALLRRTADGRSTNGSRRTTQAAVTVSADGESPTAKKTATKKTATKTTATKKTATRKATAKKAPAKTAAKKTAAKKTAAKKTAAKKTAKRPSGRRSAATKAAR